MRKSGIASILVLLLLISTGAHAQESNEFTRDSILAHYRDNYPPRQAFDLVQEAALWLAKESELGLKDFALPYTKWNTLDDKHLQVQIWSSEDGFIVRHPNPKLHHLVGILKLANQHKDHSGRLAALEQINRMMRSPKEAWSITNTPTTKA